MFVFGSVGQLMALDNGDVVAERNVSGDRLALRGTVPVGAACANDGTTNETLVCKSGINSGALSAGAANSWRSPAEAWPSAPAGGGSRDGP